MQQILFANFVKKIETGPDTSSPPHELSGFKLSPQIQMVSQTKVKIFDLLGFVVMPALMHYAVPPSQQPRTYVLLFSLELRKTKQSRVRSLSLRFHDGPRQLAKIHYWSCLATTRLRYFATPTQNYPRPGWRDFLRLPPTSWPATNPRDTDHPRVGLFRRIWRQFFIFYKFFVRTSACIFNQQGRGIPFTCAGRGYTNYLTSCLAQTSRAGSSPP